MSGNPIILLHGIGGSARYWAPQVECLTRAGFAPVPLDFPGFGARPPVDVMAFEDLAADVEAAVARLGDAPRPVLLGHSFGGMVAQTMLRRRPRAYAAAILFGTSPAFGDPKGDFQKQFVADRLRPLDEGRSMRDVAVEGVAAMMSDHPDPAGRALAIDIMAGVPATSYRAAVQCLVGFDERANLGAIAVPVLCLVGEQDRNAPAPMMQRMAGRIPGARYVRLPRVGHLANLEAPAAFNAAVLDFLHAVLGTGETAR